MLKCYEMTDTFTYIFMSVNRRLDEWVDLDRFDLTNKIEDQNSKIKDVTVMMTDLSDGTDRKLTRNQKRKHDEINHVQKVKALYLFHLCNMDMYTIKFS